MSELRFDICYLTNKTLSDSWHPVDGLLFVLLYKQHFLIKVFFCAVVGRCVVLAVHTTGESSCSLFQRSTSTQGRKREVRHFASVVRVE